MARTTNLLYTVDWKCDCLLKTCFREYWVSTPAAGNLEMTFCYSLHISAAASGSKKSLRRLTNDAQSKTRHDHNVHLVSSRCDVTTLSDRTTMTDCMHLSLHPQLRRLTGFFRWRSVMLTALGHTHINKVKLRQAWLVLGLVTTSGGSTIPVIRW